MTLAPLPHALIFYDHSSLLDAPVTELPDVAEVPAMVRVLFWLVAICGHGALDESGLQVLPLRYQLIICPDAKLHFSLLTIKKIMLVAWYIRAIMRIILAVWKFIVR